VVSDRKPRCEAVHPDALKQSTNAFAHDSVLYSEIDGEAHGFPLYGVTHVGMARCMYAAGHAGDHENPDGKQWR
jgi:hypothetical protein